MSNGLCSNCGSSRMHNEVVFGFLDAFVENIGAENE